MSNRIAAACVSGLLVATLHGQTNSGPTVRMSTTLGDIDIQLLRGAAPATVENFLNYVRRGAYNNSIIHRTVPGFIIQGGGVGFSGSTFLSLPADAPVVNEYRVSNTRGTIAMAKLGGNPNSATNQWFFNLGDNSANLNNQNGGFTVFGRVLRGLDVMDQIAAVPIYRLDNSVLTDVPLRNYTGGQAVTSANPIFINSATLLVEPPSTNSTNTENTSGLTTTRTFEFSDPNGADDLGVVNVLINRALDGRNACYIGYDTVNNLVVLLDNAGVDASVLVLPSSGTLTNGQCTISGTGFSALKSGNNLSLTIPYTFNSAFGGSHIVYVAGRDRNGGNSGWSPVGTHSVSTPTSNPLPLRPASVQTSVPANTAYALTVQYRDATTSTNLQPVQVLINSALDGTNACYFGFDHANNLLYIIGDSGVLQTTPVRLNGAVGGAASIENSQCSLRAAGSTFTDVGNTLTLTLQLEFKSSFVGRRIIFGGTQTTAGANSGWHVLGAVRIQ